MTSFLFEFSSLQFSAFSGVISTSFSLIFIFSFSFSSSSMFGISFGETFSSLITLGKFESSFGVISSCFFSSLSASLIGILSSFFSSVISILFSSFSFFSEKSILISSFFSVFISFKFSSLTLFSISFFFSGPCGVSFSIDSLSFDSFVSIFLFTITVGIIVIFMLLFSFSFTSGATSSFSSSFG